MNLAELKEQAALQIDVLLAEMNALELIADELLDDGGVADVVALFSTGQIETVKDYLFSAVDNGLECRAITVERAMHLYEVLNVPGWRVEAVRQKFAELKRQTEASKSWEAGNRAVTRPRRMH